MFIDKKDRTKTISLNALVVTLLINAPRLMVVVNQGEMAKTYDWTLSDIFIRIVLIFLFSWVILNINILWKDWWLSGFSPVKKQINLFAINLIVIIIFAAVFVLVKEIFSPTTVWNRRQLFFIVIVRHSFIFGILWLIAKVINLNYRQQLDFLEKERLKQESIRNQLNTLRSQMNPHFLFNALNSLNALIRQKSEEAPLFVEKLSFLLRYTLQSTEKDFISLKEELAFLKAYIFLQKKRFGEKLQVSIDLPDNWMEKELPALSLQLLVENAIKHNVISNKNPLKVAIYVEGNHLVVSNPIKIRRDKADSTGKGLSGLSKRFQLQKNVTIKVSKENGDFIVKLPMFD
jgi:sensor histidine kinase YesM